MVRRSKRIAAKAKAEANSIKSNESESNKTAAAKSKASSLSKSATPRRSSRSKSCCSLQSLEQTPPRHAARRAKAQKKTNKACKALPKAGKKGNVSPSHAGVTTANTMPTSSTAQPSRIRRVTASPSTKFKSTSSSTVTQVVTPGTSTKTKSFKGVQFNLGRNSFAQYNKENPPNVVEHLTEEVTIGEELFPMDDDGKDDEDDATTRRNVELLEEWEANFEDLDEHVSRRARRISMLP